MKIGTLLSIRDKSTRYPGKVTKTIHGKTVTEHLLSRLKIAAEPDVLLIATSTDSRDGIFDDIGRRENVSVFKGSLEDKLLRYRDAARQEQLGGVVIVDGDRPGSNYIAAELKSSVEDANKAAERLGLPIRFAESGEF